MKYRFRPRRWALSFLLLGWVIVHFRAISGTNWPDATNAFANPPADSRLRMFWRVFGPAWRPEEIDYQLHLLKDAGVGGVTAFFMYPVELDDPAKGVQNQRFLSPEFLDTFRYAASQAHRLGLSFGVAGGTGWPYGGPTVSVNDAAQRLRQRDIPSGQAGSLGSLQLQPGENVVSVLQASGTAADQSDHAYIAGPTGMRVKRPAYGGEGLVLDHINSKAAERYLDSVVAPMLKSAPGLVDSVFCDSLEMYGANWTADFPKAFRSRRGYDLAPLLPELFSTNSPRLADLRFDFWRTHAELTEERFTKTASQWMHRHGVRFEMEAYGTPPNPLTAASYIDIPCGEQYEWKGFSLSRLAASGAHLAGKNIVSAEAWTWIGLPNRLGDTLRDLKLASDLHFLAGINELIGVDFPYSPRSAGAPGWLPYYGPVMNQNNPQWSWFHDLATYISRCQWLLRQGSPVADVALYLPVEDSFAEGGADQMLLDFQLRDRLVSGERTDEFGLKAALRHRSDLIDTLLTSGFNYDGIDFFSVDRLASVADGRLVAGNGRYRIIILPNLTGMDYAALAKIARFCRAGGTVIATRRLPDRCYGYRQASDTPRLRKIVSELFGAPRDRMSQKRLGRGWAIFVPDETDSLAHCLAGLDPDVRIFPPEPGVGWIHRRDGPRDIYFVAQTTDNPLSFEASLRSSAPKAAFFDPMTGRVRPAYIRQNAAGRNSVNIALSARGSTFIIFDPAAPASADSPRLPALQPVNMNLTWKIRFDGTNPPSPRMTQDLKSWTEWPDARFHSGTATYLSEFPWTGVRPSRAMLIFSEVHDAAEVSVNGQRVGSIWNPPLEIDIAAALAPGTNTISVVVGNTPLNGFLGLPDQDLAPLRKVYGNRFPAPEEKRQAPPEPSGLVGPVRLEISP